MIKSHNRQQRTNSARKAFKKEIRDSIRGASSGFLFGIPLLYTMEVWWIGSYAEPLQMLIALVTNFVVVFLLIRTEGFRGTVDTKMRNALMDSIETLAIGFVCTALTLVLLREINLATSINEAVGKIIFESVPFSLGVAVANSFLSGDRSQSSNEPKSSSPQSKSPEINATFADVGATSIGALFIAFTIAPTEEVPMLASAMTPPWLIAIIAASLLISYGIVFVAGLTNQDKRYQQEGLFHRPITETLIAYLVSLMSGLLMLWFFHQLSLEDPWTVWLSHAIVLGLPATIGGAAGRIVV
ncbi:TIGR02587 family membrane protein [Chamaesiphon minutus]|uniref:Putative integral membrane protein TIGR02587 n=1 Tax=Chamaesiphon minutus (strain ATCC 27169 / PCC 6605) TaxID=1173020 RepID=K9UC87_CHAP6|nr:TIGR02587 family membrane protein [Chamaesiphon minutus]AFY92056.1 putative integral membrane protein TIGR02587 [Chamaesiphon minutus PCC 6605]